MFETAINPLNGLRQRALRARDSDWLERIRHVRVDAQLTFLVHAPRVDIAACRHSYGEILAHPNVLNQRTRCSALTLGGAVCTSA